MTKKLQLTTELSDNISKQLMLGKPLTRICQDKNMPSLSKVYDWINSDQSFAKLIDRSRRIGSQYYLDKMIDELENASSKDTSLLREKLIHYRWMASKLLPGIYGDKTTVETDSKIEITWNVPINNNVIEAKVE